MGQLNCSSRACSHAAKLPQTIVCIATGEDDLGSGHDQGGGSFPSISKKGLNIWAETAHDLLSALPFELDADTDHLHAPAVDEGASSQDSGFFEVPNFARDVGVCCEAATCNAGGGEGESPGAWNQDNYACIQVDDPSNPWGLYAVSDGHGPEGHLMSTLLVHELPSLLATDPGFHRHTSMALHHAFVAVGEMASSCQFVDAGESGGTLSAALLRPGVLHVAWVGDSKVVLGRSVARPSEAELSEPAAAIWNRHSGKLDAYHLPPASAAGPRGLLPRVRAVEITSDHVAPDAAPATDAADGAGGPAPLAGPAPAPASARAKPRRCFGSLSLRTPSAGDLGGGAPVSCEPEVRRMRLRPEDLFAVLGTAGLWAQVSPDEAVALVGQHLRRMAGDAAAVLQAEAARRAARAGPAAPSEDITVVVVYLKGKEYVAQFDPWRASHVPEDRRGLLATSDGPRGGCPAALWCSDGRRPPVRTEELGHWPREAHGHA